MKELLAVISLVLSGAVAEAPYPPSGFRPAGPAFELPQKVSQNQPQQQEYLPPVDPRIPSTQYGFPEEDVSVQGLPTVEQRPIFQISAVNGQQYVGPNFNTDIRNLDDSYKQSQYQQQQEQYREFERQRQLEAAQARNRANQLPTPQVPRQFVPDTTPSTTEASTTTEATTESLDLNEGETLEERDSKKEKVSVEVSKQNLQAYPGELFLSSLAQLQLQPQFVPFGQIRAPLYFQAIQQEPSQKQVSGYDAATHFAALPSVLAQQQYIQGLQAQNFVNPAYQQQVVVSGQDPNGLVAQNPQPFVANQYQPVVQTPQSFGSQYQPIQPQFTQSAVQPQAQSDQAEQKDEDQQNDQEQPQFVYQQSYQPQEVIYQAPAPQQAPVNQYQPQQQSYQPQQQSYQPQQQTYQPQQQSYQPQQQTYQPQQQTYQPQQQTYQPQQQTYQPQGVIYQAPQAPLPQQAAVNQYQPQAPQTQYQPQEPSGFLPQAQLVNYPSPLVQQYQNGLTSQYQNGLAPQQVNQQQTAQASQGQGSLQSGLDVNQDGNGVEQEEDDENTNEEEGPTSVAVATAFGARTQPRVFTRYGAPVPVPRVAANPQTTTEAAGDEQAEEGSGAVAEANAFAGRRKSAKLRSRRVRPLFTLDRSGHLVLAQQ